MLNQWGEFIASKATEESMETSLLQMPHQVHPLGQLIMEVKNKLQTQKLLYVHLLLNMPPRCMFSIVPSKSECTIFMLSGIINTATLKILIIKYL